MNDQNYSRTVKFTTFNAFYPFYLSQHEDLTCRRLHVIGCVLMIVLLLYVLWTKQWLLLFLLPVIGYGFAWVGHFFFEKNKPATFQYPLYSLAGDWLMFWHVITGKVKI